jgi:hypothetical protein
MSPWLSHRRKQTFFLFTGLSVPVFVTLPYLVSEAVGKSDIIVVIVVTDIIVVMHH